MSQFGGPGGSRAMSKPTPPERGSFPLDHFNECKAVMRSYLACMKRHRGVNVTECRMAAKAYLQCRMERNLMAKDEMKNLGFGADGLGGVAVAVAEGEAEAEAVARGKG